MRKTKQKRPQNRVFVSEFCVQSRKHVKSVTNIQSATKRLFGRICSYKYRASDKDCNFVSRQGVFCPFLIYSLKDSTPSLCQVTDQYFVSRHTFRISLHTDLKSVFRYRLDEELVIQHNLGISNRTQTRTIYFAKCTLTVIVLNVPRTVLDF